MAAWIGTAIGAVSSLGSAALKGKAKMPDAPSRAESGAYVTSNDSTPFDGSVTSPFSQSWDNTFTVATGGSTASARKSESTMPAVSWWIVGAAVVIGLYLWKHR